MIKIDVDEESVVTKNNIQKREREDDNYYKRNNNVITMEDYVFMRNGTIWEEKYLLLQPGIGLFLFKDQYEAQDYKKKNYEKSALYEIDKVKSKLGNQEFLLQSIQIFYKMLSIVSTSNPVL